MNNLRFSFILAALLCIFMNGIDCHAQFKEEAFSQQYNSDTTSTSGNDSTDVMFSFREYFGALGHKNEMKIGTMFAGSAVFIGGNQIYNRQYWKLPIVYGAIGGSLGAGIYFNTQGNKEAAKWCFVGAGVAYWATMMDGVINYKPSDYPHAGKATLYSLLVPGLGQIYNREYWKVPIYLGLMGFGIHYYSDCAKNFERFRSIYLEATNPDVEYTGPITSEQALYYRNLYRRYRDYALLATVAVYVLQIIDANVFAYMHDFEVSDSISMRLEPAVIAPDNAYALQSTAAGGSSIGLKLGVRF